MCGHTFDKNKGHACWLGAQYNVDIEPHHPSIKFNGEGVEPSPPSVKPEIRNMDGIKTEIS